MGSDFNKPRIITKPTRRRASAPLRRKTYSLSPFMKGVIRKFAQFVGKPALHTRHNGRDFQGWLQTMKQKSYRQLWIDLCISIGFETLHYDGSAHQLRSDVIREIVYNVVEPSAHESPKIVSTNARRQVESDPSKQTLMSVLEDQWERLIPGHLLVLNDELDGESDQEVEHNDGSDHSTKTSPSPIIAEHETCVSPRCHKVLSTNVRPTDSSSTHAEKKLLPPVTSLLSKNFGALHPST